MKGDLAVPRPTTYLQRAGAAFRCLLNDLKRNEAAAARELGIELSLLRAVLAGEQPLPEEVRQRAVALWPVNERDFFPIHDDTSDGVRIMRGAESAASSRVFQRGGSDYYEYRDTAMSHVAMIRPEWIKMLHVVSDRNPLNPTVRWNNGHFLYQFTYFIGEVNYYYEWHGRKFCAPMTTGDSVFGLPFARHSFASRNPAAPGHILALTYGGSLLGDAQHELGVLGEEAACQYVLPLDDRTRAQAALLRLHVTNGSYAVDYLAAASGVDASRIQGALDGEEALRDPELQALADAMRVPVREFLAPAPDTTAGVVIVRRAQAPTWLLPDAPCPCYRVRELAGSRVTPYAKSLELEIVPGAEATYRLATGLHEYGYNHGLAPCVLGWSYDGQEHRMRIEPDDSFYLKPHVPHWFEALDATGPAPQVLLLRVGGKLAGSATLEASAMGRDGLRRVVAETMCWYNPEGDRPAVAAPRPEPARDGVAAAARVPAGAVAAER